MCSSGNSLVLGIRRSYSIGAVAVACLSCCGAPAAAGSLSIGPFGSEAECQDFCRDLVFNCNMAIFTPSTGMCKVWDDLGRHRSERLAVGASNQQECDEIEQRMGTAWYWDPAAEWCIEGTAPVQCTAADWSGTWDTRYQCMDLNVGGSSVDGIYQRGTRDYRIYGRVLDQDPCVFVGTWDHNDGDTGPVRLQIDQRNPLQFSGCWARDTLPTDCPSANGWHGTKQPCP